MKTDFYEWSQNWKLARNEVGCCQAVLDLWQSPRMPEECKRPSWLDVIGYRKSSAKDRGEQRSERLFLGKAGEMREHSLIDPTGKHRGAVAVRAIYHNMAQATQRRGQVIADCFGTIHIASRPKLHPLAVEVKETDGNCWFAVVENLQQVRMLRFNAANVLKYFQGRVSRDDFKGAWGMVLAPRSYYVRRNSHLKESERLLDFLAKTKARIILAENDELKDGRILWRAGYWPK